MHFLWFLDFLYLALGTRKVVEISNSDLSAFDKYANGQSIRFLSKIFTCKVKIKGIFSKTSSVSKIWSTLTLLGMNFFNYLLRYEVIKSPNFLDFWFFSTSVEIIWFLWFCSDLLKMGFEILKTSRASVRFDLPLCSGDCFLNSPRAKLHQSS